MAPIPDDLAHTVREVHGDAGELWLRRLPELLAECAVRWSLTVGSPFPGLTYHYVASAIQFDATPVVLKAGPPNRGLSTEIAALRHFGGRGAVHLLDADEERGLLLLERLDPGETLVAMADDDAATRIAAGVMRRLWTPPPPAHSFPSLADLGRDFRRLRAQFGGAGPLPPALVEGAESLLVGLLASPPAPILLHGDLHHGNVLSAQRAPWLAIDPKGIVGEPAFEVGQFLLNPTPQPKHVLARRLDIFADELGLDRPRLRAWGLVKSLLSAWWSVEDHGSGWEAAIDCANHLAELPGSL